MSVSTGGSTKLRAINVLDFRKEFRMKPKKHAWATNRSSKGFQNVRNIVDTNTKIASLIRERGLNQKLNAKTKMSCITQIVGSAFQRSSSGERELREDIGL